VDGVFSTFRSNEWYQHPERVICPVMLGQTSTEFTALPPAEDDAALEAFAKAQFGEDAEQFLSFFTRPATKESLAREGLMHAIGFAIRSAAKKNVANGVQQPLYAYNFDPEIPGWDNPGTFHSVDLWFFFETLAKCWRPFTGKHYDLARNMCDYWVNFIRTGDPNGVDSQGKQLPLWPALTEKDPAWMVFDDRAQPERWPLSPLEAFLLEHAE